MDFYNYGYNGGGQPTSAEEDLRNLLHGTYTASVPPFIQQEIDELVAMGSVDEDEAWEEVAYGLMLYLVGESALACLQEAILTAIMGGPIRLQPVLAEAIDIYPEVGEELIAYIDDLRRRSSFP